MCRVGHGTDCGNILKNKLLRLVKWNLEASIGFGEEADSALFGKFRGY